MYVIFPAEELINISLGVSPSENKSVTFNKRVMAGEVTLKELTHPALNEALKTHNSVTFKLVRTVSDFTQQLSQIYEQHAEELQHLVEGFRKKNAELRKERPACPSTVFHAWETLLQEVEIDSQAHSDIASILGRQVSRPLLERSFYRKIQSRKVFTHRESYDTILHKTEDMLTKCRQDYKAAFLAYMSSPSNAALASYFDAHNAYVQQLHATNGMLEEYSQQILPQLMQELEEVYSDLCAMLADSVLQGAEIISTRAVEQGRRYDGLSALCRGVSGPQDLAHFVRSLQAPPPTNNKHNFSPPQPPQLPTPSADEGGEAAASSSNASNTAPILRNELTLERLASIHPIRPRFDALKKEANDLETQIKQLTDALDNLLRMQQRSVESSLFNKANELQEDISLKRFDLRVAQIHLSAVKAQKELFAAKVESGADTSRERKMSSSSTGSMKSKWLKAFKSLKTTSGGAAAAPKEPEKKAGTPEQGSSSDEKKISPSTSASSSGSVTKKPPIRPGHSKISSKNQMYHAVSAIMSMRKNGKDAAGLAGALPESGAHLFQEYTYKKITPCDVCSQVLRGHTRQGLRCRVCKMNVHVDCQDNAKSCQSKSRLLRRQKSTSEIETRVNQEPPLDEERIKPDRLLRPLSGPACPESPSGVSQRSKRRSKRQQSTLAEPQEVDQTYQVLKQAGEISGGGRRGPTPTPETQLPPPQLQPQPPIVVPGGSGGGSIASSHSSSAASLHRRPPSYMGSRHASVLTVNAPNPGTASSSAESVMADNMSLASGTVMETATSTRTRRRLFAGMKSLSVFHSRASHERTPPGHAHSRSISLPESLRTTPRTIEPGTGTRPFGQPLVLSPSISENGDLVEEAAAIPSSYSPVNPYYSSHYHQNSHQHHYYQQLQQYPPQPNARHQQDLMVMANGGRVPTTAPHSPRRHKLNLRMKSLSLDSPESTEHVQRRRHVECGPSSQSSSSHIQSPSSPVHNRRLLSARNMRMSSVELPDDNEKSLSSASTSPCPSPKPHRLLPTNLYVVLYNFKSRHPDELDLKAGYKVTVIDTSDVDWWRGKCLGRIGFFPSKYVIRLQPGERPLQVTHNLQVSDGDNGLMLLRDQIVIQIGEELDGMVMIRSGDNRQGVCPLKFLQEV
ncbi:uncharacterized protein LOC132197273 isoform X2 [Neocloeon triangulifer]|uniref:uncharacterized protein LOC132197273 isoform X2 n=1 Tax=Neocloeon triangulifer TaxID=2078957 RepID=UPI00286F1C88|nr:uncharacterized protein LOC132197273 isoform X2 [Neocloeon triangulifer]